MAFDKSKLEIWGGVECTMVRLGDAWRSQLAETGHIHRDGDMELIASMGLSRVRYPVLWEMVSPLDPEQQDWAWCDRRLGFLRDSGTDVIAGLLHHGSGPRYTNLLDDRFPELFTMHARRVALRYPWIRHYTPVNEPLTTARFSCLYGHWHPHRRSFRDFLKAVFIQSKATVMAMQAIRQIRTDACLVQTDDLGRTFSTPRLAYQADFDNERRWLAFDLILGRVDRNHPFHRHLMASGITEKELDTLREAACPIDIMGINHYLTSERYLDEKRSKYPEHLWGGNQREGFADAEAVRVALPHGSLGPKARLLEAWNRYHLPLAVTEVQHGCNRDDQLRWVSEVVGACHSLRDDGVDVRAVTAWALFGGWDWNSLMTDRRGHYEPGAADLRSERPRVTAIGRAWRSLAASGKFSHPVLDAPGWWKRSDRFYIGSISRSSPARYTRPILIIEENCLVAKGLAQTALGRGTAIRRLPLHRIAELERLCYKVRPWAIVSTFAGEALERTAVQLARACTEMGMALAHFTPSRSLGSGCPQLLPESAASPDRPGGERTLENAFPNSLILRHGPLFTAGRSGRALHETALAFARGAEASFRVPATYLPDFAHAALDLLTDGETGVWHLGHGSPPDWATFADWIRIAELPELQRRGKCHIYNVPALRSERAMVMPSFDSAFGRFLDIYGMSFRTDQHGSPDTRAIYAEGLGNQQI